MEKVQRSVYCDIFIVVNFFLFLFINLAGVLNNALKYVIVYLSNNKLVSGQICKHETIS